MTDGSVLKIVLHDVERGLSIVEPIVISSLEEFTEISLRNSVEITK